MTDHREEILKAFKIGPEDIAANRSGMLTERQKQQLIRSGFLNVLFALIIGAMLTAIVFFVATRPLVPVQVILYAVITLVLLLVGSNDYRKTRAAAEDGRTECLTGPISVKRRGKAGYYVTVAGRSFQLGVHFWHLQNGAAYRVYVAPLAKRIVAMEPDGP